MCVQENLVCTLSPECVIAQAVTPHLGAPTPVKRSETAINANAAVGTFIFPP